MAPFTLSVSDAAKALGLGKTLTYELIKEGRLETVKIGRRRLVTVASIAQLLETSK